MSKKGYFWEGAGLLLFAGTPLPVLYFGTYDADGDLETAFCLLLLFTCFLGFGLYLARAAHISISAASLPHKLLAVWLPLLLIVGGYMVLMHVC